LSAIVSNSLSCNDRSIDKKDKYYIFEFLSSMTPFILAKSARMRKGCFKVTRPTRSVSRPEKSRCSLHYFKFSYKFSRAQSFEVKLCYICMIVALTSPSPTTFSICLRCRQGLCSLQLCADEATGSVQWKMTHYPRSCVKPADKSIDSDVSKLAYKLSPVSWGS